MTITDFNLPETAEEIMEAIWRASENRLFTEDAIRKQCCEEFGEPDLKLLENHKLIIRNGDKILFTDQGKVLAEGIIRRHRLAEVLVTSILKVKHAQMEEIACQVEHCLHPEVEEAICTLLGHPVLCPDGKLIPKGRCCEKGSSIISNTVLSLTELSIGEKGKITFIKPGSHSNLHQLLSFGLQPGIIVSVHRTSPAFCIKFDNTELALDAEIAQNIFVWKINK